MATPLVAHAFRHMETERILMSGWLRLIDYLLMNINHIYGPFRLNRVVFSGINITSKQFELIHK